MCCIYAAVSQVWLSHLSDEMKNTLQELLKSCLRDAKAGRGGLDPNKYPSQVGSTDVVLTEMIVSSVSKITQFNHVKTFLAEYTCFSYK